MDDILYNNIEFFFSETDLKHLMPIEPLSYDDWASLAVTVKETKDDTHHNRYNIMLDESFLKIKPLLKDIKLIAMNTETAEKKKGLIKNKIAEIEQLYEKLHYYKEVYVHAHFMFNRLRKILEQEQSMFMGGGMSLNEFKERIRQKIKLITNQ